MSLGKSSVSRNYNNDINYNQIIRIIIISKLFEIFILLCMIFFNYWKFQAEKGKVIQSLFNIHIMHQAMHDLHRFKYTPLIIINYY